MDEDRKSEDLTRDSRLALIRQKPEPGQITALAAGDPEWIVTLLEVMESDKGSLKFYCDKVIRTISQTDPLLVYPYFQRIARFLDSPNSIMKWGAIRILADLAAVDHQGQFEGIHDRYFDLIDSDSMITAANVIGNAWRIIQAFPDKESDITQRLLKVPANTYLYKGEPSPECRNILIGKVIECFDQYFQHSADQRKMLEFAAGQTGNDRPSTAKTAAAFLNKHHSDK